MWALSNYAQGCGIALVDGVDLELTTFLSRHDDGELCVLVGLRKAIGNCMGLNKPKDGTWRRNLLDSRRSKIGGRRDKDECFI
jgi:hypothetical protein